MQHGQTDAGRIDCSDVMRALELTTYWLQPDAREHTREYKKARYQQREGEDKGERQSAAARVDEPIRGWREVLQDGAARLVLEHQVARDADLIQNFNLYLI